MHLEVHLCSSGGEAEVSTNIEDLVVLTSLQIPSIQALICTPTW